MSENPKAFIPAWLNNAGLSQAEFRVYCCLAARKDIKTGIAWPMAETISADCSMAKNTVWKSLRGLEKRELIRKAGKPFGGSNRYQVLVPATSANEMPIEAPTSANEIPIEEPSNRRKSDTPIGANEILQSAQMDSREGITNNSNQVKATNKSVSVKNEKPKCEPSPEAMQLAILFKNSLPQDADVVSTWKKKWPEAFDKQITKGRTVDEIQKVIRWARTDSFWRKNFLTPAKLDRRNKDGAMYYDVFKEAMLTDKSKPSGNQPSAVNMGNRKSNSTDI